MNEIIAEQLKRLPVKPGVYFMKDAEGIILYVGKAANLHNRVRSYFNAGERLTEKIQRMVTRVHDIDFFVTGSEQEALILELNLIKRHRPRYNVRLKDDKTFPYLKIDLSEDWPRVQITRRLESNGARYFGPFASAKSIRQTLNIIKGVFPFRNCNRTINGKDSRVCLEYHINGCLAPCINAVTREEYNEMIKQVILFLEGRQERVLQQLKSKMEKAAANLDFEKAALLRDQIRAVEKVIEANRIAAKVSGEQDIIAFAGDKDEAYVQVFFVRGGKLIGRESFVLQGTKFESERQIMASFIKQFYSSAASVPPLLVLQYVVEDKAVIEGWLEGRRGGRVRILVPRRGGKKELIDIVAENARQGLEQLKIKQMTASSDVSATLTEVKSELGLPRAPSRIEGYDISNIQGTSPVGSMVVFDNGKPKSAHYRRFRIKTVEGANDYAMLQEVLRRRFKRVGTELTSVPGSDTWAILPDLILIDGGKGQLSAAREVLHEVGADSIPVAGLAKENEEIYLPDKAEPIVLSHSSPGLQLLQRVRDEAHRFALSYHLKVRKKKTFTSSLDGIAGIGPKRKRALLRHFGSVQAIRDASEPELASIAGMSQSLAKKIKEQL